jgi:hypothetical protein
LLSFGGWDKCVFKRRPPVFFGTRPIGEQRRFEIGLWQNGPAIHPNEFHYLTSFVHLSDFE